jgi:ATP-dependent DNA ligase
MATLTFSLDLQTMLLRLGVAAPVALPADWQRPMLAKRIEIAPVTLPAYVQPKLNGIRCIARADGLYSRNGNKITSMVHIEAALARVFAEHRDLVLDGELYCHQMHLGAIAGAARGFDPADERIGFHVFDAQVAGTMKLRLATAAKAVAAAKSPHIVMVQTTMIFRAKDLDRHYQASLKAGYEGQMIRDPRATYEPRRTDKLIKRKPHEDAEAQIISLWRGPEGKLMATLREDNGTEFDAQVSGSRVDQDATMMRASDIAAWTATFRFQGRLPSGLPLYPVVTLIHEGARY